MKRCRTKRCQTKRCQTKRCQTKRCQTKRCQTKRCQTKRCPRKTRKRGGGRTWFLTAQGRQDHREEKELERLTKMVESQRIKNPKIVEPIKTKPLPQLKSHLQQSLRLTDTISLETLELLKCTETVYNDFIQLYKQDIDNLCINKKTGQRTQSLFQFTPEDPINRYIDYTIIYLFEESTTIKKHIIAFALVDNRELTNYNIITLELLCSHRQSYNIDGKPLGIFLLDYVYNKYRINIGATLLKIQPSTPDLIPYYIKWKTPSVALDNIRITGGYLIYGNIANIEDKTLIHLFNHQLNGLHNAMDELSIKELPYDLDTLEKKKSYLTTMALESENESDRFQIPIRLDMIQYSTIDDIRKKLFINY
jgi:hypothetical protein